MIRSHLVEGAEIPTFDSAIEKIIGSWSIDGGSATMTVAVENAEGEIYRMIKATGMGAYMHVVSGLSEIGLEDVLEDSAFGENGIDSRFVVSDKLRSI